MKSIKNFYRERFDIISLKDHSGLIATEVWQTWNDLDCNTDLNMYDWSLRVFPPVEAGVSSHKYEGLCNLGDLYFQFCFLCSH